MREIKFRVWSGNMWLDGGDANIHCKDLDSTDIELVASYPHSKHILCQFTGLKDKHGKEIYEGDIVKASYRNTPQVVEWIEKNAGFSIGGVWSQRPINANHTDWEIIGNIYENSELIK